MPKPRPTFTSGRLIAAGAVLILALAGAALAVRVPPGERPYMSVAGGGFVFNYRQSDAYYAFTATLERPVHNASAIEATFEDPSGGPPLVVTTRLWGTSRREDIRSPSVYGIVKDRPYTIKVRLLDGYERVPVFERQWTVRSNLEDGWLPAVPPPSTAPP